MSKDTDSKHSDVDKTAPIELMVEFLQSLENSEYVKARELCLKVLSYEPTNTTMQQYMNALSETIKQNEETPDDEKSESSDDDDSENESDDSRQDNSDESASDNEDDIVENPRIN